MSRDDLPDPPPPPTTSNNTPPLKASSSSAQASPFHRGRRGNQTPLMSGNGFGVVRGNGNGAPSNHSRRSKLSKTPKKGRLEAGEEVDDEEELEYEEIDDELDFDGDDDNDEDDEDDNSSNYPEIGNMYTTLRRASSRQSIQSSASDAFSLPVGNQDEVSSLEYENAEDDNEDDEDFLDVNNAGNEKKQAIGSSHFSFLAASRGTAPREKSTLNNSSPSHDTPGTTRSPRITARSTPPNEMTRQQQAAYSKKGQANSLHRTHSSDLGGLGQIPLVETDNETDAEGDESIESTEKMNDDGSLAMKDLLSRNSDGGVAPVPKGALRLHQSLFLPPSEYLLSRADDDVNLRSSAVEGPVRSGSLEMEDASEHLLAQHLPPELDLNEARKYIAQLAKGIPDTATPLRSLSKRRNLMTDQDGIDQSGSQYRQDLLFSTGKSSAMSSEYTEIVIGDESERDSTSAREYIYATPTRPSTTMRRLHTKTPPGTLPSSSGHLSEYTEVVVEEDEETSLNPSSSYRRIYRSHTSSLSYEFTEIEDYEEEEIIEEEIIEETEVDETEYEAAGI